MSRRRGDTAIGDLSYGRLRVSGECLREVLAWGHRTYPGDLLSPKWEGKGRGLPPLSLLQGAAESGELEEV